MKSANQTYSEYKAELLKNGITKENVYSAKEEALKNTAEINGQINEKLSSLAAGGKKMRSAVKSASGNGGKTAIYFAFIGIVVGAFVLPLGLVIIAVSLICALAASMRKKSALKTLASADADLAELYAKLSRAEAEEKTALENVRKFEFVSNYKC